MSKLNFFVFLIFISTNLKAQTAAPTDSISAIKKGLLISGNIDAYVQLNSHNIAPLTIFTRNSRTFAIGMANIKLEKNYKKVGFMADLGWGKRPEEANGEVGSSITNIKQLYVTYLAKPKLKFTIGYFNTFIGYEMVDAPLNNNYSMTYGFTNGAFYHNGIKADYTFNEHWAAMLGIFNETDKKIDLNGARSLGGQLSYSNQKLKVFANYVGGNIAADTSGLLARQLDLTATYQANDKASFGLNSSAKLYNRNGKNTNWLTNALYFNYKYNDHWLFSSRAEYFTDTDGEALGALKNSIFNATFTINYKIDDLRFLLEARTDNATQAIFQNTTDPNFYNQFQTLLFATVYSF